MKLILLLIPLLFFITSCSIDWNDEKDKKIAELNQKIEEQKEEIKEIKDDGIFKKNKECLSYLEKMDMEYTFQNIWPNSTIFYSPIKDSCIYTANQVHRDSPPEERFSTTIKDILRNEVIFQKHYWVNSMEQVKNDSEEIIKNLKWE